MKTRALVSSIVNEGIKAILIFFYKKVLQSQNASKKKEKVHMQTKKTAFLYTQRCEQKHSIFMSSKNV